MKVMNPARYLIFASLLIASGAPARAQSGAPGKTREAQIAKLIAQLGDDDADQREQASRQLASLDQVLPRLRDAARSCDAEVRRRAQTLIATIESRLAEQFIKEAVGRVNEEGLDLFIDRMVLQKDYPTEARYKAAIQLVKALAKRAEQAGATAPKVLEQDFLKQQELTAAAPASVFTAARVRVQGMKERFNAVHNCLLFSSGSLQQLNSTNRSILFVNGDIEGLNSTTDSVIICTGTIKSFNFTRGCIIFCNGIIEQMNSTQNNAIFVRGELRSLNHTVNNVIEARRLGRCTVSQGNTYVNCDALPARAAGNDHTLKLQPSMLDLYRFFDPARFGLEYTMADGDVLVAKVTNDTAFARAGLRKGDLILAIERQKFLTADQFVPLLRQRVVAGSAQLKVQRDDRIVSLRVQFNP